MGVVARYVAAYMKIDKMFRWDKDMAYGPIIKQGTHFDNDVSILKT
jgi:Putative oxidoreductase C terminal domain